MEEDKAVLEVVAVVVAVGGMAEVILGDPRSRMQRIKEDMSHQLPHYLAEASKHLSNQQQGTPQIQSNDSITGTIVTRAGLMSKMDICLKHVHQAGIRLGTRLGAHMTTYSSISLLVIHLE